MKMWRKVKIIGEGDFGTVHLAHPLASCYGQPIAVKSAKCSVSLAVESLKREAGVLRHLAGAPNVVQCFGEDESLENSHDLTYNLLLEYASLGTLDALIKRVGPMPEPTVACYASMLLRGLAGIHSRGIAHCDLKPDNVLVFPDEYGGVGELKIADFGLSKWDSGRFSTCMQSGGKMSTTASPEGWGSGHHYDCPCEDVWSMGCIIMEMVLFRKKLSPNGNDFLDCCLNEDAGSRWSAERLLEHPFIVDNLRVMDQTITHNVPIQPWISTKHMFSEEEPAVDYQPQPVNYEYEYE